MKVFSFAENIALGKPAFISSLYNNKQHDEVSGPACLAVNGNANITFRPQNKFVDSPDCVHSADSDSTPWWKVDLGQNYTIRNLKVFARAGRKHI